MREIRQDVLSIPIVKKRKEELEQKGFKLVEATTYKRDGFYYPVIVMYNESLPERERYATVYW